jgi:hypothetical protein
MGPSAQTLPKKMYEPPKLTVYGDLVEITRSKTAGGQIDAFANHMKRT